MASGHRGGELQSGDRFFESSGRSQRDTQYPARHERLGVLLHGRAGRLDSLVQAAGGAETAGEDHREVGGQRVEVERAAGFRDAPLELSAGPLKIEERVPAAAERVIRIELQRSLELLLRRDAVILVQQGRTRQRGVAASGIGIELDRPSRCRHRLCFRLGACSLIRLSPVR